MTVATTHSGGHGHVPEGLEDVSASDLRVPRLKILHKEARFQDPLTNESFEKLTCIMLGVVKQRVMWHKEVEEGDVPQCRSLDFDFGRPNLNEDLPRRLRFPEADSNFSVRDFEDANGDVRLPCAKCAFTKWTKDGSESKPPRCSEQMTFPLYYTPDNDIESDQWSTGILTFQKTGIKPASAYLSSFYQRKKPMFTAYTEISLKQYSRGTVEYCVPQFTAKGDTPFEFRGEWAEQYKSLRNFLRQQDPDDAPEAYETSDNTNTPAPSARAETDAQERETIVVSGAPAPAQTPTSAPEPPKASPPPSAAAAPTTPPAAPASADDDELPF